MLANPEALTQPSVTASNRLAGDESIRALIAPIQTLMRRHPGATEVCMSTPGDFAVFAGGQWLHETLPEMTKSRCMRLVEAVAFYVRQEIAVETPILSTTLPGGERIQIVIPPACDAEQIVISIRIPTQKVLTLQDYSSSGILSRFAWIESQATQERFAQLEASDQALCELLRQRDLSAFLRQAVQHKKNIAVVGDTGSGKTTLMKALCLEIPTEERLVTIEDARELNLPRHQNKVHLLYAKTGAAAARATPAELIAACMRLFPQRVLLAELRGAEAFDFLKLMTTGHAGSITSFHAESCAVALDRWVFMAKEHRDAGSASFAEIKRLVSLTVDVLVHIKARSLYDEQQRFTGYERFVSEVAFDPGARMAATVGQGVLHV